MCGICGFISSNSISEQVLTNMNNSMYHRGPDDSGVVMWEYKQNQLFAGFGHRRLSIIDLTHAGHQPMQYIDENGRVILTVVFNGEIYNYKKIKNELAGKYHFMTKTDTEVILASYLQWGDEFLKHIEGMFAIALFDHRSEKLLLARDRIGKKPLYYWSFNQTFVFASELKAIMLYPTFNKTINNHLLPSYLSYGCIRGNESIFENTYKLRPGSFLTYINGKMEIKKYWDSLNIYHNSYPTTESYHEVKEKVKVLLQEAVKDRLVADVPVGTFLSGGIDSSLITAIAQEQKGDKIQSFSIGFFDKEKDEAPYARDIAKFIGTEHTEMYVGEEQLFHIIQDLPYYYDEPFSDSSQIPSMIVAQLARNNVTVALTGDGGDEFFCGYPRYKNAHYAQYLDPIGAMLKPVFDMERVSKTGILNKVPFRVRAIINNRDPRCKTQIGGENYITLANSLTLCNEQEVKHMVEENYDVKDWMMRNMLLDINYCLPDDFLTKVDRASMRFSLETRCPLLDTKLMEYALSIPIKYKFKHNELKSLLKDVTYDYIPKELLDRPKRGFEVPMEKWLKGPLKKNLLEFSSSNLLKKQGLFNSENTIKFINYYLNTNDKGSFSGEKFTNLVWAFYVFQRWYDKFISF